MKFLVFLVLFSLLLTPSIPTVEGIPSIRIDDVILISFFFYVLIINKKVLVDLRIVWLCAIVLCFEVGLAAGALAGYQASLLDHFYLFRMFKLFGVVLLASEFLKYNGDGLYSLEWVIKRSSFCGLVLFLIAIQQYFDLFSLNEVYVKWVAPTQYETLVNNYPYPRPVGMIGNPNELSFLFGLLAISSFWMAIRRGSRALGWGILTMIFVLGATLTLSRSGVFATLIGMAALVIAEILRGSRFQKKDILFSRGSVVISCVCVLVLLSLVVLIFSSTALRENVLWRFSPEYFGSFYKRVENWQENILLWKTSPFFGVGTLKRSGVLQHAADNEWLYLLRIGGFPLVISVIGLLVTGLYRSKFYKAETISYAIVFAAVAYMIPAAFFYSLVIMPLALFLMTLSSPTSIKLTRISHRV